MTDENIDLQAITDVKELKALAYDQLALAEQAQANLQAISARINQLQTAPSTPVHTGRVTAKAK